MARPSILTQKLPQGRVGSAYSKAIAATGGVPPLKFAVVDGALPDGLSLEGKEDGFAMIEGKPTRSGQIKFAVEVCSSDDRQLKKRKEYSITIPAEPKIGELPGLKPKVGEKLEQSLPVEGEPLHLPLQWSWSAADGKTPPGLSVRTGPDQRSGLLCGTPTEAGTYALTLRVRDAQSPPAEVEKAWELQVYGKLELRCEDLPPARVGEEFVWEASLTDDGNGPFAWSLAGAPAWLKVEAAKEGLTAELKGTPDQEGKHSFKLQATNQAKDAAEKPLELEVFPKSDDKPPPQTEGKAVESFMMADGRVAIVWEHAPFEVERYLVTMKPDNGAPETEYLEAWGEVAASTGGSRVRLRNLPAADPDRYKGYLLTFRDGEHKGRSLRILTSDNTGVQLEEALKLTEGTPVAISNLQRGASFPDAKTFTHLLPRGDGPLAPRVRVAAKDPEPSELRSFRWPVGAPGSAPDKVGVAWEELANTPRKGEISVQQHGEKNHILIGYQRVSPGLKFAEAPRPGDVVMIAGRQLTARKNASKADASSFGCGKDGKEAAQNLETALLRDKDFGEHFVLQRDEDVLRFDHRSKVPARLQIRSSTATRMQPLPELVFDPKSPLPSVALEASEDDAWPQLRGGFFASVLKKGAHHEVSIFERREDRGFWAKDLLVAWGFSKRPQGRVRLQGRLNGWADLRYLDDRSDVVLQPLPGPCELGHSFDEASQTALEAKPRGWFIFETARQGVSYQFTVEEYGADGSTRTSKSVKPFKLEKKPKTLGLLLPRKRHPLRSLTPAGKPAFALAVGISGSELLVKAELFSEQDGHQIWGVHPEQKAFASQLQGAVQAAAKKIYQTFGDRDTALGSLYTVLAPCRLAAYESSGRGNANRHDLIVLDVLDRQPGKDAGKLPNFAAAWLHQLMRLVGVADYARRSLAAAKDQAAQDISYDDDRWLIEGLGHLVGGFLDEAAPSDQAVREQIRRQTGCSMLNRAFRAGSQEALSGLFAYFQLLRSEKPLKGLAHFIRPEAGRNPIDMFEFAAALVLAGSQAKGKPLELLRYPKEWGGKDSFKVSFEGETSKQEDWQKFSVLPFRDGDPLGYPPLWLDPREPKLLSEKDRKPDWYRSFFPVFPASVQLLEWRPELPGEELKGLEPGKNNLHLHFWFDEPEAVPAVEWVFLLIQTKDEKWSFERQRAPRFDGKDETRELRFLIPDFGQGENPVQRVVACLPCRRAARPSGVPQPQRVYLRSYRSLAPEVLSVRAIPDGRGGDAVDWLPGDDPEACENWVGPANVEVLTGEGGKDKRELRMGPDNPTWRFKVRFNTGMLSEKRDFQYVVVPKGELKGLLKPEAAGERQKKLKVLQWRKWEASQYGDDTWASKSVPFGELREAAKDGHELLLVIGDCQRDPGSGKALRDADERPVGGARNLGGILLDTREKKDPKEDPEPELRFFARVDNKPPKVEVDGLDEFTGGEDKGVYKDVVKFKVSAEDEASGLSRFEVLALATANGRNYVLATRLPEKPEKKGSLEVVWNTTLVENGKHDIIMRVFDRAGNLTCRIITVNVANFRPSIESGTPNFGYALDKVPPKGELKSAKGPEELSESKPGKGVVEVEIDSEDDDSGIDRVILFCEETSPQPTRSLVQKNADDYASSPQVCVLYNTQKGAGTFAPRLSFDSRFSGDGEREIWAHVEDRAGLNVSGLKDDKLVRKTRIDNMPPTLVQLDPPPRIRGSLAVTLWVDEPGRKKTPFKPKGFWISDAKPNVRTGLPTIAETALNTNNRGAFFRCVFPSDAERYGQGRGILELSIRGETLRLPLELDNRSESFAAEALPFTQHVRFGAWQTNGLVLQGRQLPGFLPKDKPLRWVAEDIGTKVVESKAAGKAGQAGEKGTYTLELSEDLKGELEAKDENENVSRAPLHVKVCKEPPKIADVVFLSRGLGGAPKVLREKELFLRGKVLVLVKTEEPQADIAKLEATYKGEPVGEFRPSRRFEGMFECPWQTKGNLKGELQIKAFNRALMASEPKVFPEVVWLNELPEVASIEPRGEGTAFEVEVGGKTPEVEGVEVLDRALLAFERHVPFAAAGVVLDASKEPLKPAPQGLVAGTGQLYGSLVDKAGNLGPAQVVPYGKPGEVKDAPAQKAADAAAQDAPSKASTAAAVAAGAVAGAAAAVASGTYVPPNDLGVSKDANKPQIEPGKPDEKPAGAAADADKTDEKKDDKQPKIVSASWDRKTVKYDEKAGMRAEVQNADGKTAKLTVFEWDADGQHDKVTELSAPVQQGGRVESEWTCRGTEGGAFSDEAEDEKLLKFVFTVEVEGAEKAESGQLEYRDFIEFQLADDDGKPLPETRYELTFSDGSKRQGKTDKDGRGFEDDVVPGNVGLRVLTDDEPDAEPASAGAVQQKSDDKKSDDKKKPVVSNAAWDKQKIQFEATAQLSAEVKDGDGKTAKLTIYEWDADEKHDKVAELSAPVQGGKLSTSWKCLGVQDGKFSDESEDSTLLKFFFEVELEGAEKAKSGFMEYRDFVEFHLTDEDGVSMALHSYTLVLSDGSERKGTTDADGRGFEDDLPPGPVQLRAG